MKRFISKKAVAAGLVLGIAVGLTGAAVAYWTSSGTGDGSGSSAKATTNWSVTIDKVTDNTLTPGGPTQTLNFSVQNKDTGYEHLHHVVFSVVNADGTTFSLPAIANANPQCTASDFSISSETAGASHTITPDIELAPNGVTGDTYSGSITLAMVDRHDVSPNDNTGNQDNCEGVTVPVHVAAS